jgi:SAM-dependent methyltransferase
MFPTDSFAWLAAVEEGHFWFEQRNQLIVDVMRRFVPRPDRFLEAGCGTGFVLSRVLDEFPETRITGLEYFEEAISFARKRCPGAQIERANLLDLSFDQQFDAIGCFDVLEHIPDDVLALRNLSRALTVGGRLFVSVPQHRWLWSAEDDSACHQRRYTRKELQQKAALGGLNCLWHTSFVCSLSPLMLLRKMRGKTNTETAGQATFEFRLPVAVNWIFGRLLAAERYAINKGVHMPFGGSLFMVFGKT